MNIPNPNQMATKANKIRDEREVEIANKKKQQDLEENLRYPVHFWEKILIDKIKEASNTGSCSTYIALEQGGKKCQENIGKALDKLSSAGYKVKYESNRFSDDTQPEDIAVISWS